MSAIHFDVWPADDINGTALGELTQAYDKSFRRVDQAIGAGQFTINRHDAQFVNGWCAQDNLVRVRLEDGGPWDYDDERYVFAFFIESGDDVVLSPDEQGGDEITRGGRDAVVILRRAIINYFAEFEFEGDDDLVYWRAALTEGKVIMLNRNAGEALRVLLRNAQSRSPNPLAPSTHDFNAVRDSAGVDWAVVEDRWEFPIGQDLLESLGTLASGDIWWRMGTDLVLHCWDSDPGSDVSGSVTLAFADNIREAAERTVEAREAISRALVQGATKDGKLNFRWVTDAATETLLGGRREGFVEYEATPTPERLDLAGAREIRRRRLKFEGPTTMGVLDKPGATAFTDYFPGDTVSVDVPDIFDSDTPKVYAIVVTEREAGDYDVTIEFEEVPFDPVTGTDLPTADCGKCPPPTPYVPGTQPGDPAPAADDTLAICNDIDNSLGHGTDRSGSGTSGFSVVAGETVTFRITQPSHNACAYTRHLFIKAGDMSGYAYYGRDPIGGPDGGEYGPVGAGGAGPAVIDSGTFVVPSSGSGSSGLVQFEALTDGYAAPCGVGGLVDDCWTLELWHGAIDLDGGDDVTIPPSTGQQVTHETPSVSIGSSTTTLTLDWPYSSGSLRIRVDGVLISSASYVETTPGSGVVTLSWAIDADETVTVDYQAAT